MSGRAWVVVDLGFGDAGKGATTDFLVRDRGATLVVRFNGGAQAGHNVVGPDGRHHTFSQWGSGSFVPGVGTLLGPAFVLHPGALLVEGRVLQGKGVADAWERLQVDRRAMLISPFQQAAGRLREIIRDQGAHGTCGVGVGEAVGDALSCLEDALRVGDVASPGRLRERLAGQQERKRVDLVRDGADPRAADEWALLDDPRAVDRVIEAWAPLAGLLRVVDSSAVLAQAGTVVFEGAQGVLLDQTWGFHPHTTWSDCTPRGALDLAADFDVTVLGVVRSYSTRHGAGPFPSWRCDWDALLPEPHNDAEGWQGRFRRGPLDLVLLRYALDVCGGVDGLVLNHLDCFPGQVVTAYGDLDRLVPGLADDLGHRERLGRSLALVRPVIEDVTAEELSDRIDVILEAVVLEGHGPTAADRRWRPQPAGVQHDRGCTRE